MSQIPRFSGGRPVSKTSSTTITQWDGGKRTTTTTRIRELQPDPSNQSSQNPCQVCPPSQGQRSIPARSSQGSTGMRQPSQLRPPSGIRPPGAGTMRQPSATGARPPPPPSRIRPPGSAPPQLRAPAQVSARPPAQAAARPPARPQRPAPRPQQKPPMPGQYNVPAAYGPMSRQGKGMDYSSPAALRGRMESRVPKDLKYETLKVCPGQGARGRSALPGTTMDDTFSGSYNVYGGPMAGEEGVDRSELDERV